MPESVLFFEDVPVGEVLVSPGRTITETDLVAFAALSGDYNALHVDEAYARTTPYGGRIVHGVLVHAIANGLTTRIPLLIALEPSLRGLLSVEVSWPNPTRIGDTVHVNYEVLEKTVSRSGTKGILRERRTVVNDRNEVVMVSESKLLVSSRPKIGDAS